VKRAHHQLTNDGDAASAPKRNSRFFGRMCPRSFHLGPAQLTSRFWKRKTNVATTMRSACCRFSPPPDNSIFPFSLSLFFDTFSHSLSRAKRYELSRQKQPILPRWLHVGHANQIIPRRRAALTAGRFTVCGHSYEHSSPSEIPNAGKGEPAVHGKIGNFFTTVL
jgi:hypothetical protein